MLDLCMASYYALYYITGMASYYALYYITGMAIMGALTP